MEKKVIQLNGAIRLIAFENVDKPSGIVRITGIIYKISSILVRWRCQMRVYKPSPNFVYVNDDSADVESVYVCVSAVVVMQIIWQAIIQAL